MAFSKQVLNIIKKGRSSYVDITNLVYDDKQTKKEIDKIFQRANRRIQNIKKSGVVSPAYKKLIAEYGNIGGYSFFSRARADLTNPSDFERVRYDYERAWSFLNEPTSTARGAREYVENLARDFKIKDVNFVNSILDRITEPEISAFGGMDWIIYRVLMDSVKKEVAKDFDVSGNPIDNEELYKQYLEHTLTEVEQRILQSGEYLKYLGV